MPSTADFAALAPFTMDELVDSANAVLGRKKELLVSARTVRYYVERGILEPPTGGPKNARYSQKHLEVLCQVRLGLDSGLSLAEAASRAGVAGRIHSEVREAENPHRHEATPVFNTVRRLPLARGVVLEVDDSVDFESVVPDLIRVLEQFSRQ